MLTKVQFIFEDPEKPYLGPNIKILETWGLFLPKNKFKIIFYLLMHAIVVLFSVCELIDIWFVKNDLNLLLNNMKVSMISVVSIIKITTILLWQNRWKEIVSYVTKSDKESRNSDDPVYKKIIDSYTGYSRKIFYGYLILVYSTIIIVIVTPIFKFLFSSTYRSNVATGVKPYEQMISVWVPFNKDVLPGYIFALIFEAFSAFYAGGWLTSYDSNAMAVMVFFRGQLEILRRKCSKIYDGGSENVMERIKECHRKHLDLLEHVALFDSCLSPIMFIYMVVCSFMLCASLYQIVNQTGAMQLFLTTEYLLFGIGQLFMYCWHGNDVFYVSDEVHHGVYESGWYGNKKYRKEIIILYMQMRTRIILTAGPFLNLTVATFVRMLKGAYSYYTLISQS